MSLVAIQMALSVLLPTTAPEPVIEPCTVISETVETADQKFVRTMVGRPGGRLSGSEAARLAGLLARHEDRHRIERCGDVIWVNSGDPEDGLYVQADMVGTITKATASKIRVEVNRSYLIDAAILASNLALGQGDREAARRWTAQGLRLSPRDPGLLGLASRLSR